MGNSASAEAVTSADGNFVAFSSTSTNLVSGDTNGAMDVFVYNRATQAIQRVSVNNAGQQATYNGGGGNNAESRNPSISADGRFVAFQSRADNLVSGDSNGSNNAEQGQDIFVYDRSNQTIQRVTMRDNGTQTQGRSQTPSIAGDGATVAYVSSDANIVGGQGGGANNYIYVVSTSQVGSSGGVVRVPIPTAPPNSNKDSLNPAISTNGSRIAFRFNASSSESPQFSYDDIWLFNRSNFVLTPITGLATSQSAGAARTNNRSFNPSISADGRFVAFDSNVQIPVNSGPSDTNSFDDVFAFDAQDSSTVLVSVTNTGTRGNGDSSKPSISGDGSSINFDSAATNLVSNDTNGAADVLKKDGATGVIQLVSLNQSAMQGNGHSSAPSSSANGNVIAFTSAATNLAAGDTNNSTDVFASVAATPTPTPSPTPGGASKIANISTRGTVGTGDNVLIGGTIVTGDQPKTILARAIGPSTGVPGALADPFLLLRNNATGATIAMNNDWQDDPAQAALIRASGIPPSDPKEAAIVATLTPPFDLRGYTVILSGANNTTGIALVEVFGLD